MCKSKWYQCLCCCCCFFPCCKYYRKLKADEEKEEIKSRIAFRDRLKQIPQSSNDHMREYRMGYPGVPDNLNINANKEFYFSERRCKPDDVYIENILNDWKGDYDKLERLHGFIQWLFPIRTRGMNDDAFELQPHEAQAIVNDSKAHGRVVLAYQLMLDFYGMLLTNKQTGDIERAANWKDRFANLNRSSHNNLRITRILKSLGELGYEHYKEPFISFMIRESMGELTLPNCAHSCLDYWIHTIRDQEKLDLMLKEAIEVIDENNRKDRKLLSDLSQKSKL